MNIIKKVTSLFQKDKAELWIVVGLMLIAGLAHGMNLFHYPYFENDEATYVSQAWSTIHSFKLAPYGYYYDHAPLGWMFLGLWFIVTGGLTTFGHNPIISGRIFIFLLHMCSVLLLYIITKRITRQKLAAALTVIIFSLSPLEIYYGRRVLLDNIMVFWLLWSLFFATKSPQRLRNVVASAVMFACAALSKENALFMGPAILYMIWIYTSKKIRLWSIVQWVIVAGSVLMLYPLYALLKGEFFPTGTAFGGTYQHVSLLQTLAQQAARGAKTLPWLPQSDFYMNMQVWIHRDPWIILGGAFCLLASMILNEKYREIKAVSLTAIGEILFLARGQLVIDFYILAVLPLLAMIIAIMVSRPVIWAKNHISPVGYALTSSFLIALIFVMSGHAAFTKDETTNQQKSISWIEQHVPKNAYISIDNYAYPELHDVDGYENADFSFKIEFDPNIKYDKYHNDPNQLQYMLITHEEIIQMRSNILHLNKDALQYGELVADYRDNTTSYINISKLISTNGDWSQVYRIDPKQATIQTTVWRNYKRDFITDAGQVIDLSTYTTTSEGQSYALLRSLDNNDEVEFDTVWKWTKKNLQVRSGDKLFSWKVQLDETGANHLTDKNSAADADEDIALALYKASVKWNNSQYLSAAKEIIGDIWKKEVVHRSGTYYLIASPEGSSDPKLLVNPSYLAPSSYKLFAQIDKTHNWKKLADDSYTVLAADQAYSKAGLVSNWIAVNPDGSLGTASLLVNGADTYGYDAFRVNKRMADDISDPRAVSVLQKLSAFYHKQWENGKVLYAEYTLDGNPQSNYSDVPTSAGAIIGLHAIGDTDLARQIYTTDLVSRFNESGSYWGQATNYYSQNWAAFALTYAGNSLIEKGETIARQ